MRSQRAMRQMKSPSRGRWAEGHPRRCRRTATRLWMPWIGLLVLGLLSAPGGADWPSRKARKGPGRDPLSAADLQRLATDLGRLRAAAGAAVDAKPATAPAADLAPSGWQVTWRPGGDTPAYVRALPPSAKPAVGGDLAAAAPGLALEVLAAHAPLFGLARPASELALATARRSADGACHVRFERRYDDLPVLGEDLVVHLDGAGRFRAFNGHYSSSAAAALAVMEEAVDAQQAVALALADRAQHQAIADLAASARALLGYDGPTARRCLRRDRADGRLHLTWEVEVRPNLRDRWLYYVDAGTGQVVDAYNTTPRDGPATAEAIDGAGVSRPLQVYVVGGTYYLIDASRAMFVPGQTNLLRDPLGVLVTLTARSRDLTAQTTLYHVDSPSNTWSDSVAVSAHANMGVVYEYYRQTHGRAAIDGDGGSMYSVIHVTDNNASMENAYWSGTFVAYGDGGDHTEPLAEALDVAAHEMTHGVVQYTVNLEYRYQSGALNESLADVFAAMVDRDDWTIGEDIVRPGVFPTGAMRDLAHPHNGGTEGDVYWQPGHMDEYVDTDADNGGVHINGGIPSRAAYLVAARLGREAAEDLYYRVLDGGYINRLAEFVDMRNGALQAAADLYGADSEQVEAVAAAYDSVGIVGGVGYEPPPRAAPAPGERWILAVADGVGGDAGLYLVRPDLESQEDVLQLTTTPVYHGSGDVVAVDPDGAFVLFVDGDNNLRSVLTDGTQERIVDDSGQWSSLALAPDGRRLATTTTGADSTIYLVDLTRPDQSRAVPLRRPTTQEGITAGVVLFADALDWDRDGQFLVYDAFNSVPTAAGDSLSYWDVALLDPESGQSLSLLPPQPEGVQIGNPQFAHTTAQRVVFDYYDGGRRSNQVRIFDLVTGHAGAVAETGTAISYPAFSVDDREILYGRAGLFGTRVLERVELAEDGLSASGPSTAYLNGARLGRWLAIAPDQATAVEETAGEGTGGATPAAVDLLPAYPNPFNSHTVLRYRLPAAASVELSIFDVRGVRVVRLASGPLAAGEHTAVWDGRDGAGRAAATGVYLSRLVATLTGGQRLVAAGRLALLR